MIPSDLVSYVLHNEHTVKWIGLRETYRLKVTQVASLPKEIYIALEQPFSTFYSGRTFKMIFGLIIP